jgi:hypothetical protein
MGKDIIFNELGHTDLKGFNSPVLVFDVRWE